MTNRTGSADAQHEIGIPLQQAGAFGEIHAVPLVVDLDGTLTPTDTLAESVIQLVRRNPFNVLRALRWLLKGRAGFKDAVTSHSSISAEHLPYCEPLLAYLRTERQKGRRIILATAAHRRIADRVSTHLGVFDEVIATEDRCNLKGDVKLEAIVKTVGRKFVYAGDSIADIPIWKAAHAAVLVGVSAGLSRRVRRDTPVEQEFPRERAGFTVWVRAFRVHQWVKNVLLFVPLLTAFSFMNVDTLATMTVAFLAFSLAASATYMVNDLWDLENDRAHQRKRHRPFASAQIPILLGLCVAAVALTIGLALALAVSQGFLFLLLTYLILTSAYSWVLKEYVLIDVILLSLLYTLRILAGSVAAGIATSSWLLAFSVFVFLSLALVKRCSELVSLDQVGEDAARGRDYRVTDMVVLWPLGVGAAMSAVVVFGLFIAAPETQARYAAPQLLGFVAVGLIYWLARLWVKTSRGEMHDDPVVYAVKDRGSRITVLVMIATVLAAHFVAMGPIR
ncbi:MAG: UbiA family prenyltransferase [Acidobacteria bacterium]|nr:UbiA family prenyltransferase [Acidobacteriota bacterium]